MTKYTVKGEFTATEISHEDGPYPMTFDEFILDGNHISAKGHDCDGSFIMNGTIYPKNDEKNIKICKVTRKGEQSYSYNYDGVIVYFKTDSELSNLGW